MVDGGIEIRRAVEEDAGRICEINESALGYSYPPAETRQRLKSILARGEERIFVACLDGEIVGYIHGSGYECLYCAPLKNIMALAVDDRYRGRGAGRILLKAMENWAKECGCAGIRLVSGFDRLGAHEFYRRCGYSHRKDQKNFIKYF